jgi:ribose transport system substrate-binding protein
MHEFQTGRTSTASTVSQAAQAARSHPTGLASSIAAPAKASKNYNLQFIQGVAGDEFYITMNCGMQAEAAKLASRQTPRPAEEFDPTLQKPILDSVVAAKPDAILIAPTDRDGDAGAAQRSRSGRDQDRPRRHHRERPLDRRVRDRIGQRGGGKAAFEAIKQLNPNGGKVMVMSVDPAFPLLMRGRKALKTP